MGRMGRLLSKARAFVVIAASCAGLALPTTSALAQNDALGIGAPGDVFGGVSVPTLQATLTPSDAQPGDIVRLSLRLQLPPGSNTYSQDPSFQRPTTITVSETAGLDPLEDKYVADPLPKREYDRQFMQELEKHFDEVTWTRRFRLRNDVPRDGVFVRGKLEHLVCDDENCVPQSHMFAVSLTGKPVPPSGAATLVFEQKVRPTRKVGGEEQPHPAGLTFALAPQDATAGGVVRLTIRMEIDTGWHGYSLTAGPNQISKPTVITLDELQNLEPAGEFSEQPEPTLLNGTEQSHHGTVVWTREFRVSADGGYGLSGSIRYQLCDEQAVCLRPNTVPFALGRQTVATGRATTGDTTASAAEVAASVGMVAISPFSLLEAETSTNLLQNLLFAFLGGLILNVMPCVLPVIAIKVLSFVQQAGESRGRIFALNGAYAGGVVLVFLALAVLAVSAGYGWGELFQKDEFNLAMAAIVFAMGLSLLGVFEIPVPGMVGSAAGGQHREGLTGAFMTGIFATLLATPCSGPFMGTTLAWSVKQPALVAFLVWGTMGLGMASPYLLIGAFPQLVNWLPRPGMWMVRLKEFAGFVLMGAVIWLMNSINRDLLIPTLIILVGVALGLWMIGNLYDHAANPRKKWSVRAAALTLSAAICGYGWSLQYRGHELPWQKFSTALVNDLRQSGDPVLIDFTADWCAICKTNEKAALNRPETVAFVKQHGIVPVLADYTDEDPEIKAWLDYCKQEGVPLTLIFPRGRPDAAIPLRGLYSQSTLLTKLKEAIAAPGEPEAESGEAVVTENESATESATTASPTRAGLVR